MKLQVLTTMGVGELSAINGIAGSYAENMKIIYIVAATSKAVQEKHLVVHHTLGSKPGHRMSFPLNFTRSCGKESWIIN